MEPTTLPACPICTGDTEFYCKKQTFGHEWTVARCKTCGHGFVVNRPDSKLLGEVYASDVHLPHEQDTSHDFPKDQEGRRGLVKTIERLTGARGESLDVGSGEGGISNQLAQLGFKPFMIDMDPRAQVRSKKIPGSSFQLVSFEDLNHPGPFGVIVMSQVLEHALDPSVWLRKARSLLAEDGILAIAVPNFAGVYRLLGERDPYINPPIHLNFFTAQSLRLAIEKAGLQVRATRFISQINTTHPTRHFSFKRRFGGRIWNMFSPVVDWAGEGIILREFAGITPG